MSFQIKYRPGKVRTYYRSGRPLGYERIVGADDCSSKDFTARQQWSRALEFRPSLREGEAVLLAERARAGDLNARNQLCEANLPIVLAQARLYSWAVNHVVNFQDLLQEGNIGLLRACAKWRPDKGEFSTYATYWIAQALRVSLRHRFAVQLPHHKFELFRRYLAGLERFSQIHGYLPESEELADFLNLELEEVEELEEICAYCVAISLDDPLSTEEPEETRIERVADQGPTVEEQAIGGMFSAALDEALTELAGRSPRHARIMRLRLGLGEPEMNLAELARLFNVKRQRIHQITQTVKRWLIPRLTAQGFSCPSKGTRRRKTK